MGTSRKLHGNTPFDSPYGRTFKWPAEWDRDGTEDIDGDRFRHRSNPFHALRASRRLLSLVEIAGWSEATLQHFADVGDGASPRANAPLVALLDAQGLLDEEGLPVPPARRAHAALVALVAATVLSFATYPWYVSHS